MKELKLKQRIIIHYSVVVCVIFLQTIVAVVWAKESNTETKIYKKFHQISTSAKMSLLLNEINNSFLNSQVQFRNYVNGNDYVALKNYFVSLNQMSSLIDSLKLSADNSKVFKQIISNKNREEGAILSLKSIIDSIAEKKVSLDSYDNSSLFKFNNFKSKSIFDDIKISANEKLTFFYLRDKKIKLIELNDKLLNVSNTVLLNYNNSVMKFQTKKLQDIQNQNKFDNKSKNFTTIPLTILILILSLVLLDFTRLAFENERRLIAIQGQVRQSLNFKNRIVGMISHEIRSPLHMIAYYSRIISSSINDYEIKKNFKSIEFTVNSLLLLSNQILEYSKNERNKFELKNNQFELKTEIDQIISIMSTLVQSNGNRIEVYSNLDLNCIIYSDVTKIHQLFYNIIGNANRFTENGLISIWINFAIISEFEVSLKIEVQDNGSGISKDDLKYVFDPYYQGTVLGKVHDLGVGLGLNLCKEIVGLFDGQISIESEEGVGTKVSISLILSQT